MAKIDVNAKIERIVKQVFGGASFVDLCGGEGTKAKPYHITVYAYGIMTDYINVVDGKLGTCDFDLTKKVAQNIVRYGYKNFSVTFEREN